MTSFDFVPTLNQALKCSILRSFFVFFTGGGFDEDSVSGAGVEPVEVAESSSLSMTLMGHLCWSTIMECPSKSDGSGSVVKEGKGFYSCSKGPMARTRRWPSGT